MRKYEITFITKENLADKENPFKKELTALGGKTLSFLLLGQKQLAYKIKKENRGFFTSCLFEIEPEKLSELNRKLSLEEKILRFLIIMAPKIKTLPVATPKKIEPEVKKEIPAPVAKEEIIGGIKTEPSPKEKPEKIEVKKIPKIAEKPEKIEKPVKIKGEIIPEVKKEKVEKVETEVTEEKSEEERLAALDKKLDELLKE